MQGPMGIPFKGEKSFRYGQLMFSQFHTVKLRGNLSHGFFRLIRISQVNIGIQWHWGKGRQRPEFYFFSELGLGILALIDRR